MGDISGAISKDHITHPEWSALPETVLRKILGLLPTMEVVKVGMVCKRWHRVASCNCVWKKKFCTHFHLKDTTKLRPDAQTWKREFKRLRYTTPLFRSQRLTAHDSKVYHVTFSHNGKMFASCSKDSRVIIWNANYPCSIQFACDMNKFSWCKTWCSEFNKSDTMLMVSGCKMAKDLVIGEVAVFKLIYENEWVICCRVRTRPSGAWGGWFNDELIMTADTQWLDEMSGASCIWLSVADQAALDFSLPNERKLLQVSDEYFSKPRFLMTACCPSLPTYAGNGSPISQMEHFGADLDPNLLIFCVGTNKCMPHIVVIKRLTNPSQFFAEETLTVEMGDYTFSIEGHICGLTLSPDQTSLYVNVRMWDTNESKEDRLNSPYSPGSLMLRRIDLVSMDFAGPILTGHKASPQGYKGARLLVDVSDDLVTSGAKEPFAYLWDRHYGICLTRYYHKGSVNCAVFNPTNPGTLVTAGDDGCMQVWQSAENIKNQNIIPLHSWVIDLFGSEEKQILQRMELRRMDKERFVRDIRLLPTEHKKKKKTRPVTEGTAKNTGVCELWVTDAMPKTSLI